MLYLDIDDTLLSWASGEPRAVAASECFLRWAMERFEVRWLTRWCPGGEMADDLLADLAKMVGFDVAGLAEIPACAWDESGIKADGIAWLEHAALGRDFAWVENRSGLSERDFEVLEQAGYAHRYFPCDVTEDAEALERTRVLLEGQFDGALSPGGSHSSPKRPAWSEGQSV